VIVAKELDPSQVSPGVPGFLVTFALALACWLLFRSLTKHLRRVNHSEEPVETDTTDAGDPAAGAPAESDAGDPAAGTPTESDAGDPAAGTPAEPDLAP